MKISVTIKPNAKQERIVKTEAGYVVHVKAPAFENKANKALIETLSAYFDIPKSRIAIISGNVSRHKIIEVKG